MSLTRREWLRTFSDQAVLSDLRTAARELMRQVCQHDPSECDCELNRFTPMEFAEWIELEVQQDRQRPMRFEPAGRPGRKSDDLPPEWSLSAAG